MTSCIAKNLPVTYESFSVFNEYFHFEQFENYTEWQKGGSCTGRLFCLGRLVVTPVTIPLTLLERVVNIVQAIFSMLASIFKFGQQYFEILGNRAISVFDHTLALVASPLTLLAAPVRYLFGCIHPKAVFSSDIFSKV